MREQDPMLEVFIFETQQLLESLEETLLQSEKEKSLTDEHINEIFRIMHTIKGSASMMSYDSLAKLAHALEDLFDKIREGKTRTDADALDGVFELVLAASDNFKAEIDKLSAGVATDGDYSELSDRIHAYLATIMGSAPASVIDDATAGFLGDDPDSTDYGTPLYKIRILFEPECLMENMRAFGVVNTILPHCQRVVHEPADLNDDAASDEIAANGFVIFIQSGENPDVLKKILDEVICFEEDIGRGNFPSEREPCPDRR